MAIDYSTVKVRCKNCGKEYPANTFVLDYVYKMMVCPNCVKDRQRHQSIQKEAQEQPVAEEIKKRPAGWDKDDEYLEKLAAQKEARKLQKEMPVIQTRDGRYRYRCPKCHYEFYFNNATKTPSRCPYCNWEIFS